MSMLPEWWMTFNIKFHISAVYYGRVCFSTKYCSIFQVERKTNGIKDLGDGKGYYDWFLWIMIVILLCCHSFFSNWRNAHLENIKHQISLSESAPVKVSTGQSEHRSKWAPVKVSTGQSQHRLKSAPVKVSICQSEHWSKSAPVKVSSGQSQHWSKSAPVKVSIGQSQHRKVSIGQSQHWSKSALVKVSTGQSQHSSKSTMVKVNTGQSQHW